MIADKMAVCEIKTDKMLVNIMPVDKKGSGHNGKWQNTE